MKTRPLLWIAILPLILASCGSGNELPDAYGNFESDEITISAEANGKLISFEVEEGARLSSMDTVGLVDTIQLHLRKQTLKASIQAVRSKTVVVQTEIDVLLAQKDNLVREVKRVETLVANKAATQQQLDDLEGKVGVVNNQITAARTRLSRQNQAILSEVEPMEWQIRQIDDQIRRSLIINPVDGVVLTTFANEGELAAGGRPLYVIADLENIELRAYVEEPQLASIQIGADVEVAIDDGDGTRRFPAQITWVASASEFTPKTVQTQSERANLVYAVKAAVKNDGAIKLGMPGELWISNTPDP